MAFGIPGEDIHSVSPKPVSHQPRILNSIVRVPDRTRESDVHRASPRDSIPGERLCFDGAATAQSMPGGDASDLAMRPQGGVTRLTLLVS